MEDKAFKWAQSLLTKNEVEVDTVHDFTRADVLAALVSLLAKRKVDKLMFNARIRIEHMQNLNIVLAFARHELQLRNLHITGEELLNPNFEKATKAVMNVLSMLYKKYGAPVEEPDIAEPLVEWARVTSDVPIPTLKSMHDGRAFLSIITKLSENIVPVVEEEDHNTSKSEISPSCNEEVHPAESIHQDTLHKEADLQFNQTVIADGVCMALFLVKRKFGIVPPFTSNQICSGDTSSILSFLSLLHNVAIVNQTKTQIVEANTKTTGEIRALREENEGLEKENGQITSDADIIRERVKTENLDWDRLKLRLDITEMRKEIAELARSNEEQKDELSREEKEKQETAIYFKLKLEKHVFVLREHLLKLGNVGPVLAEIYDQLGTTKHLIQGLPHQAQLEYLQYQIDAESEVIANLQQELEKKEKKDEKNDEPKDEPKEE